MNRGQSAMRCISVCLVLLLAACAFAVAAVPETTGVLYASNSVSASVRAVQPAVSGLFQVHTPRIWTDAIGSAGEPGANGVPDFLDTWEAFGARVSVASLDKAYAFTTVDALRQEILYAGVDRAPSGAPAGLELEFNQTAAEDRRPGDLRISVELDADGNVGTARFERFAADGKIGGTFLPLAVLRGEGCNDTGSVCLVANGSLLEVGYNLSALGKPEKDFASIVIRTPEATSGARIVPMFSSGAADCVKEIGGLNNATCTAGDVRLGSVIEGSLIISEGCNGPDTCAGGTRDGLSCTTTAQCTGGGTCVDTVTFTARGSFNSGPQRYDVGVYFAVDGDPNGDGARSGDCERFAFPTSPVNFDGDSCGDVNASSTRIETIGPVKLRCVDANNDGLVDIKHCETWAQSSGEINCLGPQSVKAGTPSKCDCSLLQGPGSCIAIPDNNPCTVDICQGACSNSSTTTCVNDTQCLIGGVQGQCTGITLKHIAGNAGTECRASTGVCDAAESCDGVNTACPTDAFASAATQCRASTGVCDPAEFCTGSSGTCPSDSLSGSGTVCRAAAGPCDAAESCTGSSATCPNDGFVGSGTICRAAAGVCDQAESCSGSSANCPADVKLTSQCRASAGECDQPESCNGTSNDCPADALKAPGTACGSSADTVCDNPDTCNGTSATCQINNEANGTNCGDAGTECINQDTCQAGACQDNGFKAPGTACGSNGDTVCDNPDTCNASGTCNPNFEPTTTVCRGRANTCDKAEFCDGAGNCPGDVCLGDLTPISLP
jgi:hypothetical protein